MKRLKKLVIVLLVLLILSGFTLWIFSKALSPATIKNYLNRQMTALTGQPSKINGSIHWHLLPRPGIKITKIQIGNPKGDSDKASIENLFINLQAQPLLRGKLIFSELKIDGFKIFIGNTSKTLKPAALEKTNETIKTAKAPAQFAIDHILLTKGQVEISHSQGKTVLSGIQLAANQLNLRNKFFPIQLKGILSTSLPATKLKTILTFKGRSQLTKQNLMGLQNSTLEGQLLLKNFQLNAIKIPKITATGSLRAKELILNPLNLTFYKGKSVGNLNYNIPTSKLTLNQTATRVNAQPLLKALLGRTPLNGNIDFSIHANTLLQGADWRDNLVGNGNITAKEGVLNFVNLNAIMKQFTDALNALFAQGKINPQQLSQLGKPRPEGQPKGKTNFKLLSIQYQLQKSMLLNDTFVLQTDKMRINGSGSINLRNSSITNRIAVKLYTSDKLVARIQKLLNGSFPLQVSGTLNDPAVYPEVAKLGHLLPELLLGNSMHKPLKTLGANIKTLLGDSILISP